SARDELQDQDAGDRLRSRSPADGRVNRVVASKTGQHFSVRVGPRPHALYALRATAFGLSARLRRRPGRLSQGYALLTTFLLSPWMCLPVRLQQLRRVEMRVALRGAETRVAEELLNRTQVGPAFQQMRGERVPQGVRADAESRAARRHVAPH